MIMKEMRYLDLYGGHAVISRRASHPYYVNKLNEQAQKLVFLLKLSSE